MDNQGILKDNIKNKISTKLKENTTFTYDEDTQPHIAALDLFLRKSSYKLIGILPATRDSNIEILIAHTKAHSELPDIIHEDDGTFTVMISEDGLYNSKDLDTMITKYESVRSVLKYLGDVNLSTLEI